MLLITQGHEKSISLEVFIKSFICLSSSKQKKIILYCYKSSLTETLNSLKVSYHYKADTLLIAGSLLKLKLLESNPTMSQSLHSLERAIEDVGEHDLLVTLPTSKDQFQGASGHTEYFRKRYQIKEIPMSFLSENMNSSLLTDHIAIKDISKAVNNSQFIANKVSLLIENYRPIKALNRVLFSGINPHNGESGMMGDEERELSKAINTLRDKYKDIEFLGPYPGDTLVFNDYSCDDLLIFSAHDQGLGVFKQQSGLMGINITFGLPFLRLSPDHGTAFDLYLKNQANYQGCLYLLEEFTK